MNAIQHALNELKHRIPPQVLQFAFTSPMLQEDQWSRRHAPLLSLDHIIRDKVIQGRIMPAINLTTGQRINIPITGLLQEYQPDMTVVMQIPKAKTQGRTITCCFGLVSGSPIGSLGGNFYGSQSGITDSVRAVMQSRGPVPQVVDQNVQVVGDNVLWLRAPVRQSGFLYLDCLLETDQNLSNMPPASWKQFAKLVEFASKAWIYNNSIIPMDQAQLSGGMSIGRFREVIDSYADANELYEEQLTIWEKVFHLTDPISHQQHVQGLVGGLFP